MNILIFFVLLTFMFIILCEPSFIFEGGGKQSSIKDTKKRSAKKRKKVKVEVIDLTEKGKSKYNPIEVEDDEEENLTKKQGWYCEKPYNKNNINIKDRAKSCKQKTGTEEGRFPNRQKCVEKCYKN